MKKVVSLLFISFALCLVLISCGKLGDSENVGTEGLKYTLLDNGTYEVSGIGTATYVKDIVIPETHEGKAVTKIGNGAFYDCRNIKSVVIPNSVIGISGGAFSDCKNLTSIEIPNSVTSIGHGAFAGCESLASIELPSSVISVGDRIFSDCYSLSSIIVDENNTSYKSIDGNLYDVSIIHDGTVLIQYAIGKEDTSFVIPSDVTSIGKYAFSGCTSLNNIVIPNSVKTIEDDAFSECTNLESVKIEYGVTSIGNGAFLDCESITNIEIPNSVTSIGNGAFARCKNLKSVAMPNNVTIIESGTFSGCESLKSIVMPNSVIVIDQGAFWGCDNLTIYCEAEEKPTNWDENWCEDIKFIYWYSESEPSIEGNYWHYDENGEIAVWSK